MRKMNAPLSSCSGSSLGLLFRQARDAMWARLEYELAAAGHELTFSQYVTLKMLSNGPAGVTDLARFAELNPGAMTRLLDKLEERGLIERQRLDSNRRVVQVGITAAGLALLKEMDDPVRQCGRKQLGHLPAADLSRLTDILRAAREPHEDKVNPWT